MQYVLTTFWGFMGWFSFEKTYVKVTDQNTPVVKNRLYHAKMRKLLVMLILLTLVLSSKIFPRILRSMSVMHEISQVPPGKY